jgi:ubiquinone/menaquinone biosynthesis C-methylase UbiE
MPVVNTAAVMSDRKNRVCPVEKAGSLDTRIRRWLQNPQKILKPYIDKGMTVLDFGCGPGFFTIDMAEMVGKNGCVFAVDLQEGMLEKLKGKIQGTEIEDIIILHKSESGTIGLQEKINFALAFYVLHELPSMDTFFQEVASLLKPGGQVLIVEPPFHVNKSEFKSTLNKAKDAGLIPSPGPKLFLNKSVVLTKGK